MSLAGQWLHKSRFVRQIHIRRRKDSHWHIVLFICLAFFWEMDIFSAQRGHLVRDGYFFEGIDSISRAES